MNVYVRELAGSMARAGVPTDVFVRRNDVETAQVVDVEPGVRVVQVAAGPLGLAKEDLPGLTGAFADGVRAHLEGNTDGLVLHAHYWLSGVAGHQLKHELDLPLVTTFHTLDRVKAQSGLGESGPRGDVEADIIGCSDAVLASCEAEARQLVELYDCPRSRIELLAPGVDHAFFSPGDRAGARSAVGLGDEPVMLFVGRIQPLKGLRTAVLALTAIENRLARLVVIGGASGRDGEVELASITRLAAEWGVAHRIDFVDPQPHHLLAGWYRAADVVLVPSHSESFGLVALEASACGVPVIASRVGGLTSLVDNGRTGFLVAPGDHRAMADRLDGLLASPQWASTLGEAAHRRSLDYTWPVAAGRFRRLAADLSQRSLVRCPA